MASQVGAAASASAYWSAKRGYAPNWYSFCAPYINRRVTGDAAQAPTPWAMKRAFAGVRPDHLLEIGCLDGKRLVNWIERGLCNRVSGVDIAEQAIARGQAAHGDKVNLAVMDLNDPRLPARTYDGVVSNGVLHHIAETRAVLTNLHDALKPGGWLIASEFTGPARYAYSGPEIEAINDARSLLPEGLRGPPFDPAQLAGKLAADPSESISTRTIEPLMREIFGQVDAFYFGGNVLMRGLTKAFFDGFDASDPDHVAAVERMQEIDEALSQGPDSHHTFFLAHKAP